MKGLEIEKKEVTLTFIKRYRYWLALLLFILVLVVGYFIFASSLVRAYSDNLKLSAKLEGSIKSAEQQLQQKKINASKIYQLSADEKRAINMALPEESDHSALVEHLTSMANRSGFMVSGFSLNDTPGGSKSVGRISVKLSLVGGDYQSLKNLIELLENSIMIVDVMSINFSSGSPSYDMFLVVYYYK